MKNILSTIINLSDNELEEYVKSLVDLCDESSIKNPVIGMQYYKYHKGFIGFDTKVSYGSDYFYDYSMKDYEMYIDFFKSLKKQNGKQENLDLNYLLNIIYSYVVKYFQSEKEILKNPNISIMRDQIVMNYLESIAKDPNDDEEWIKNKNELNISVFKGQGVAMCSERAALAQNLLSLFGIESYFCGGMVTKNELENCDGHAFNFIRFDGRNYILDFSLPVYLYEGNEKVTCLPFISEISDNSSNELLKNKSLIPINNYHFEKVDGEMVKQIEDDERIYGVGMLEMKEEKIVR